MENVASRHRRRSTTDSVLTVVAGVLLVVVIIQVFRASDLADGAMVFVLVCLLLGVLLLRTGRLTGLKLGKEGIEAVLAEAHEAIHETEKATKEVKEVTKTTAAAVLGLVKRTGRGGGYSYDDKEEIRRQYLANLREIGMSPEEIVEIEKRSKWHEYVAVDYVYHILQGRYFPSGNAFPPGPRLARAVELRNRLATLDGVPTPDELEESLGECNALTAEARELVKDYRYYREHHEQRRPEIWAKRDEWHKWIKPTD